MGNCASETYESSIKMKVGLLTNVGPNATEFYLSRLPLITCYELPLHKILFYIRKENPDFLQKELDHAANILKTNGCTHAAIACFSLHNMARKAFLKSGLTPIDVRDNDIGGGKFGMLGTNWIRDFIPHSFYPNKQRKLHDLIMDALIDEDPTESDLKFLQECIDDMTEQGAEKIIIGCTDLTFVSKMNGNFINLPEIHVNQIADLMK